MKFLIPILLIILFIAVRKYYRWKAYRKNEKRKQELKADIDFLLSTDEIEIDEHEKAISN